MHDALRLIIFEGSFEIGRQIRLGFFFVCFKYQILQQYLAKIIIENTLSSYKKLHLINNYIGMKDLREKQSTKDNLDITNCRRLLLHL